MARYVICILTVFSTSLMWSHSSDQKCVLEFKPPLRFGTVETPGFPNSHSEKLNCTVYINQYARSLIMLTFHEPFHIEEGNNSSLKIFETSPSGIRQQKASYSGDTVPPTYISTTNRVEMTFTSDGSDLRVRIRWKSICGSWSSTAEGLIYFPDSRYYYNKSCRWFINAPSGHTIMITIFSNVSGWRYWQGSLKIFETSPLGVSQQRESYSYETLPQTYASTTNRVEITFTSADGIGPFHGFYIAWNSFRGTVLSAAEGSITSPNYPNNYDDDSDCRWIINEPSDYAIIITFHSPFQIELQDFLKIFETSPSGVHQQKESYSGDTVPPTYTSTTNRVEITFTSDGSRVGQGFNLTWSRLCPSVLSAAKGSITSLNYPKNYDDDSNCRWIINAPSGHTIIITFHSPFEIERQDYLKIFETSPSGVHQQKESYSGDTVPPTYTSTTNRVEIAFTSDGSRVGQGFKLTWERTCGSVSSAAEGPITSPNYPNNYDNDSYCNWIINAPSDYVVIITFHSPFELERQDHLKIFEHISSSRYRQRESYSGDTVPSSYTSTTNSVDISFTSDESGVGQGFNFTWTRMHGFVSSAAEGSITSFNYPNNYDNHSNCNWIINAPSDYVIIITFHSPFELELQDHLKIFETIPSSRYRQRESYSGGTVPPTYTSTTNRVEITFTSDWRRVGQGFNLTWEFHPVHDENDQLYWLFFITAAPLLILFYIGYRKYRGCHANVNNERRAMPAAPPRQEQDPPRQERSCQERSRQERSRQERPRQERSRLEQTPPLQELSPPHQELSPPPPYPGDQPPSYDSLFTISGNRVILK